MLALAAALCMGIASCGARSSPEAVTIVEGGSDSDVRFSDREPLPAPPQLAPGTEDGDYLQVVQASIQPAWSSFLEDCRVRLPATHELNASALVTRLVLVMNREGTVLEVRREKRSGNSEFDQVAMEISGDLRGLPQPPMSRLSDDGRVYLVWSFARDKRQAGAATATWKTVELPLAQALPKLLKRLLFATATQRVVDSGSSQAEQAIYLAKIASTVVGHRLQHADAQIQALALHSVGGAHLVQYVPEVRIAVRSTEPVVAIAAIGALAAIGDPSDSELLLSLSRGEFGATAAVSTAAAQATLAMGQGRAATVRATTDLATGNGQARGAALAVLSVVSASDSVALLSPLLLGKRKAQRAERTAAAAALGRQASQSRQAVKALLSGSSDGDATIRVACLSALADAAGRGLRSRVAYWRAVELLRDKDERVRAAAVVAAAGLDAARFGKELPMLRTGTTGGSNLVLASLARALAGVRGPLALSRLLAFATDADETMRILAAKSLAQRTEPRASKALQGLLADASAEVRMVALAKVADNGQLVPLLEDTSTFVQAETLAELTRRLGRSQTARRLANVLSQPDLDTMRQLLWVSAWLTNGK